MIPRSFRVKLSNLFHSLAKSYKRCFILFVCLFLVYFSVNREWAIDIPSECFCVDEDGLEYNFCYMDPSNYSSIGHPFNCSHLETLKKLELLGNANYFDLTSDELPDDIQFVTAISANHGIEGELMVQNITRQWPNRKIIAYDIGLGNYSKLFENISNVELRNFPFKKYPSFIAHLREYRWKFLIIAEVLREYPYIFWIDSSTRFYTTNLNPIHNLFRCKNKNTPLNETYSDYFGNEERERMINMTNICDKSGLLFHGPNYHSIYLATDPGMYDYLPIPIETTKKQIMYHANMMIIVRTKDVVEDILKWVVLCALEKDCMAPPGSKVPCHWGQISDYLKDYGKCNRFDQSAVNIIISNIYYPNDAKYNTMLDYRLAGAEKLKHRFL